ncbi:TP53 regulating kinase [Anticarsia gemmatalis]|uniref:TP53 regulating kinase n=1 Tax=Anticarsia gemmatalis TaxID=129554 RepID=UPI003F771144
MSEEHSLKILKQGAEAKLFICNYLGRPTLIKERFQKNYRHPDLDTAITKDRIKNEARSIVRCKTANVRTPALYLVDFERRRIYMQHFEKSITIKDFIINHVKKESGDKSLSLIAKLIGETVRKLHENNIIHGDLTTSNMLLVPKSENEDANWLESGELDLVMIDFGLSFIDSSTEDKGVDLYVLERALISTHNDYPDLFDEILDAYKKFSKNNIKEIISKFEEVRARGRKRTMVG